MKRCPSCRKDVAYNARACVNCGHRFHTFLAKLFFWIFALPLLIAIAIGFIATT